MTYRISVWYRGSEENKPQVHEGLDPERALMGLDSFSADLVALKGDGVRKITIEAEQ